MPVTITMVLSLLRLTCPQTSLFNFFPFATLEMRSKLGQVKKGQRLLQRAKKVVSSSPGLVNFAIGLVIFVLNFPKGQVLFFREIQRIVINPANQKGFWG